MSDVLFDLPPQIPPVVELEQHAPSFPQGDETVLDTAPEEGSIFTPEDTSFFQQLGEKTLAVMQEPETIRTHTQDDDESGTYDNANEGDT